MAKLVSVTETEVNNQVGNAETVQRVPLTVNQELNFAGCEIIKVTYDVVTENDDNERESKKVTSYAVVFKDGFRCSLTKLTKNFVNGKVERTDIGKKVVSPTKEGALKELRKLGTWIVVSIDKNDDTGETVHTFAPKN